jgi:hypothetical protein
MKKCIVFLLFCNVLLTSCSTSIGSKDYYFYSEGVSFQALSVQKTKKIGEGRNTTYIAPKDTRYVTLMLKFKNDTNQNHTIDFEDFYLLDKKNNKYQVTNAAQAMKVSATTKNMEFKLKSGTSKTYLITFTPPFPKDEEVNQILVKNQTIKIKLEN